MSKHTNEQIDIDAATGHTDRAKRYHTVIHAQTSIHLTIEAGAAIQLRIGKGGGVTLDTKPASAAVADTPSESDSWHKSE